VRPLATALLSLLATAGLGVGPARAEVKRVALIMAHHRGAQGETELLYAHEDARRLAEVLRRHGGFRAEDVVVLLEGTAEEARTALIALNDRVRQAVQGRGQAAGDDVLLVVYYSGHADQDALHLGESRLSVRELRMLVSGSAARFRILILDACRSGGATRGKGGRPAPAFALELDDRLEAEGMAVIAATAADEDAQESDRLRGSIFSHHLISGLLGAADASGDGRVSLGEAYSYAYDQTVKASSRTLAGTQHPSYEFDTRGQGDPVLTDLAMSRADQALLVFDRPGDFLVLEGDQDGPVVAEVGVPGRGRRLALRPGRYFLRERAPGEIHEGTLALAPGQIFAVSGWSYTRLAYARQVRKGEGGPELAHGPACAYRMRGELLHGQGLAHGLQLGWPLALRWVSLTPRLAWVRSVSRNELVRAATDELQLGLEAAYTLDLSSLSLSAGVVLGGAWLHQSYENRASTPGRLPARDGPALLLGPGLWLGVELGAGLSLQAGVEALTYVLEEDGHDGPRLATPFTFGLSLGLTWYL
jgi:hypothetical protein